MCICYVNFNSHGNTAHTYFANNEQILSLRNCVKIHMNAMPKLCVMSYALKDAQRSSNYLFFRLYHIYSCIFEIKNLHTELKKLNFQFIYGNFT